MHAVQLGEYLWGCEEVTCGAVRKSLVRFGYITMIVKGMPDASGILVNWSAILDWWWLKPHLENDVA